MTAVTEVILDKLAAPTSVSALRAYREVQSDNGTLIGVRGLPCGTRLWKAGRRMVALEHGAASVPCSMEHHVPVDIYSNTLSIGFARLEPAATGSAWTLLCNQRAQREEKKQTVHTQAELYVACSLWLSPDGPRGTGRESMSRVVGSTEAHPPGNSELGNERKPEPSASSSI